MIPTELAVNLPPSLDELVQSIYGELKQIAHSHKGFGRGDQTLQTTALVHEAYIRMARAQDKLSLQDQKHLKALTSRIIRHIIIDYARRAGSGKRDGEMVSLDQVQQLLLEPSMDADVLDLDAALNRLAEFSPRMEKVVECRFFGGMNVTETAEALEMSARSVERDWQRARIHLLRFMEMPGHKTHPVPSSG
ncbi:MAG TPA: ECF-type sigma factor [Xanthomonadales bacterium]|nr:ECF-type sigma factor [Xanthomonadales bacterium]